MCSLPSSYEAGSIIFIEELRTLRPRKIKFHSGAKELRPKHEAAILTSPSALAPGQGMEGHSALRLKVWSFGSGTHAKLPGLALDKPAVYDFKTT